MASKLLTTRGREAVVEGTLPATEMVSGATLLSWAEAGKDSVELAGAEELAKLVVEGRAEEVVVTTAAEERKGRRKVSQRVELL